MRRIGLAGTRMERAQCNTIRTKLLKVGALVRITVRKIWISFSGSWPYRNEFVKILANIRAAPPLAEIRGQPAVVNIRRVPAVVLRC